MNAFLKKRYTRILCAALSGVIVLSAAVFANYDHANGYSVCKNAVKALAFAENITMKAHLAMQIDDQTMAEVKTITQYSPDSLPYYSYNMESSKRVYGDGSEHTYTYHNYASKDAYLGIHDNDGERQAYLHQYSAGADNHQPMGILDPNDVTAQKMVTFVEKIGDVMIGDLKNSIVFVGEEDENAVYEISLSAEQLPDWVTTGVSLLLSQVKESTETSRRLRLEDPESYAESDQMDEVLYDKMFAGGEPTIDHVYGRAAIDDSGNPTDVQGSVVLNGLDAQGVEHQMCLSLVLECSDIGSTVIEVMDISGLPLVTYGDDGSLLEMQIPQTATDAEVQQWLEEAEERANQARENITVYTPDGESVEIYGADQSDFADEG